MTSLCASLIFREACSRWWNAGEERNCGAPTSWPLKLVDPAAFWSCTGAMPSGKRGCSGCLSSMEAHQRPPTLEAYAGGRRAMSRLAHHCLFRHGLLSLTLLLHHAWTANAAAQALGRQVTVNSTGNDPCGARLPLRCNSTPLYRSWVLRHGVPLTCGRMLQNMDSQKATPKCQERSPGHSNLSAETMPTRQSASSLSWMLLTERELS